MKDKYYTNWTKGYTLAPPSMEGNGDYTYLDKDGQQVDKVPTAEDEKEEEKEDSGRSVLEIIGQQNPVLWCNEQSRVRRMRMEWMQVGEEGRAPDITYTWRLRMGDLETTGSSYSKKGAKNVCAEEMAKKLDALGPGYRGKPVVPTTTPQPTPTATTTSNTATGTMTTVKKSNPSAAESSKESPAASTQTSNEPPPPSTSSGPIMMNGGYVPPKMPYSGPPMGMGYPGFRPP